MWLNDEEKCLWRKWKVDANEDDMNVNNFLSKVAKKKGLLNVT